MNLTIQDIDTMERWWIQKSRINFLAYRIYMRYGNFLYNWFIVDLCRKLQQFYIDYREGLRPVLILNTPPQHGKSWTVTDFIGWIIGLDPSLRVIYSSYSDRLGKRCNTSLQRCFLLPKYGKVFPEISVSAKNVVIKENQAKKNSELIEFWNNNNNQFDPGYFRNTTIGGAITGDSMDIGIIDDPVKGRKEARSLVVSESVWEWYEDDFDTRLSENAGIILIMTRWVTHDLTARIVASNPRAQVCNYQALATKDEKNRKAGDALFPEVKSRVFLEDKKSRTSSQGWESLYQGNPTIEGGNLIKDSWWRWWRVLPGIKYKFITADTAQKTKDQNDYAVFQCWGYGHDGNLYLLDKLRDKFESPELRREAEMFYKKHDTKRKEITDPILRGMYIEDKSSGTGLIQELRRKGLKIYEVPRNRDKILRVDDASPYIEAGRVYLNIDVPGVSNLTKEGREFPDCEFDDDIDTCISAIEITYINEETGSDLTAAMGG